MIEQYQNHWFSVIKDGDFHYIKENGSENGAVVLVESEENYIFILVRRAAHLFREQIEAPRGYGEFNESSYDTAIREVFEETGYTIERNQLEKLGAIKPNSAILASVVDVFYARISESQLTGIPDREVEGCIKIPKITIREKIRNGVISDSFTLSAFAFLWSKYP
ncbi:NUDIX hydrolase [Aliivibrio fischeri]|uniref:NUDIX hydrolase n=1 Tax=Aliivibrio fischeri TaxID=668 RepID=UPI000907EC91|nr:NUDIX domain-containing protein [Aliivibrio fischeri]MUJ26300.1 NUDIX domain-containing protein [Aliivibrio fischeri]